MNRSKIEEIKSLVNSRGAELLVVSKNRPLEQIEFLYDMGFRKMGENRVQSLLEKKDKLPENIQWHIIGHLQRNKVKYIAPFVTLIHSVDSISLLKEIQKQALKNSRVIPILLQFKVAHEDSKFGLDPNDLENTLQYIDENPFPNISIDGVMSMGTLTDDQSVTISEFKALKSIFDKLKGGYFKDSETFNHLSMGMSGDYELALDIGSTIVRLGSALFEE